MSGKHYTSSQLRKWSYQVRSRDGWRCQMCQREHKPTPERRCEAHHIHPKGLWPEMALQLTNGICLCWRCHRRIVHATRENWALYVSLWDQHMIWHIEFNTNPPSIAELKRKRKSK